MSPLNRLTLTPGEAKPSRPHSPTAVMGRPALEVADIFRAYGPSRRKANAPWTRATTCHNATIITPESDYLIVGAHSTSIGVGSHKQIFAFAFWENYGIGSILRVKPHAPAQSSSGGATRSFKNGHSRDCITLSSSSMGTGCGSRFGRFRCIVFHMSELSCCNSPGNTLLLQRMHCPVNRRVGRIKRHGPSGWAAGVCRQW